jgi:hypothetical protein
VKKNKKIKKKERSKNIKIQILKVIIKNIWRERNCNWILVDLIERCEEEENTSRKRKERK